MSIFSFFQQALHRLFRSKPYFCQLCFISKTVTFGNSYGEQRRWNCTIARLLLVKRIFGAFSKSQIMKQNCYDSAKTSLPLETKRVYLVENILLVFLFLQRCTLGRIVLNHVLHRTPHNIREFSARAHKASLQKLRSFRLHKTVVW